MSSNSTWRILLTGYTLGILLIFYLAYSNGIPSFIAVIPHYDLVFHFLLYGIWSYLLYRSFSRVLWGPVGLTLFTIAEELVQMLSVNRTFSLTDLFFSLLGIWLVIGVDWVLRKSSTSRRRGL